VPLDHLLVIVRVSTTPSIRIDKTTKGVPSEISTMGVHLPSKVIGREVGQCLVNEADDLDVVWGPHELHTLESASGDKTSAVARLGTPGDGLMFSLTDGGGAIRWCPNTEI